MVMRIGASGQGGTYMRIANQRRGLNRVECECEATLIGWREEVRPQPKGYYITLSST